MDNNKWEILSGPTYKELKYEMDQRKNGSQKQFK
jgi:hypothetical protein